MGTWQAICAVFMFIVDTLCLAAPTLQVPASSLPAAPPSASDRRLNVSRSSNTANIDSVRALPDPWGFRIPRSPLTVEFYGSSDQYPSRILKSTFEEPKMKSRNESSPSMLAVL
ncbi:hypothetical protein HO173_013109 [Letharia columbiana]|uniref:Secreted protein n=1 Tax=Letharia columbiana TaxID=112416 RepID=A0A8H6FDH9_9LECA|nr:uncharacterized protein HO173_013109 [Letharia columbiana]KAF6223864.1 hypothetical protein HO173_013109 [Letharia columbiana]